MNGKLNILSGEYTRIVVETDEANPKTIATITNEADAYAVELYERLRAEGVRVELDTRNETINLKVREHSLAKVSTLFVVGARERDEKTVAIRRLGSNGQEIQPAEQAVAALIAAVQPPF